MNTVFASSKWLYFDSGDAHMTRTAFEIKEKPIKATLYITALGYFEAYMNGVSLSDDKFMPPMSEYEKRDLTKTHMPTWDEFSYRIYYYEYDVTDKLTAGKNILGTHIGAGWYGQHTSPNEGMPKWGDNTLVFTLRLFYADGREETIVSSKGNTKFKQGYIISSKLYSGEIHDYNLYEEDFFLPSYEEKDLLPCTERETPDSELCPVDCPADKVLRTIVPTLLYENGDRKLYDIGETAAGYAVVRFTSNRKGVLALTRYSDALKEDGSPEYHYVGGTGRMQNDVFISDGNEERECYPHFTWHAARYIELTGEAEITEYRVISSDIKQISFFESDNETLNWFFDAYVRTQTANIHGCVPSDCPHRERLGYTGDGQLTCGAVMSVFDARKMYKKWMRDIKDSQDKKGGHVQHTAPFYGGGGGPGGWGGASCIVPWRYYEFYNDKTVLEDSFASMKGYIGYMLRHCEDGLVTHGEKGGWCLGDWCPPHNDIKIPESYVNTYYLSKCADICRKTAIILGKETEAEKYETVRNDANAAIIKHFYNADTHDFCEDIQGANSFALDIRLGDETTLKNTVEKYKSLGQFDTGIFGTDLLIRALFKNGEAQLAFDLLTSEGEISFYNMKRYGATTLWENWDGCDSRCHPMFGAVTEYFFSGLLGIKKVYEAGFDEVSVCPPVIKGLDNFSGTLGTANGSITVKVTTENGKRRVDVSTTGNVKIRN